MMSSSSTNDNDNNDNDTNNKHNMIDFLMQSRGLKTTPRTGWVNCKVPASRVESVADHSWRISLLAMLASTTTTNTTIDTNKCIQMALVHDLAEAVVGDITPHCGISDTDKHAMERQAMQAMTSPIAMPGQVIYDLWKEYEAGESMEAKLVKDMDKLEMILQAVEYEQDYEKDGDTSNEMTSLDGFFDSTRGKWRTEIGALWAAEIEKRRPTTRSKKPRLQDEGDKTSGKKEES